MRLLLSRRPRAWAIAMGLLAVLGVLGFSLPATSQGTLGEIPEPEPWAYAMTHDLMSPYCPGRTLAECPSPQADELRLWILTQAAAGASQEEVEAALYERFGDEILSAPRPEGWGLAAYVVPVLGFILGGIVVWFALQRMVKSRPGAAAPSPAAPAPRPTSDAELERRLEEELRS